jgi:single-strand DNA-binding protein
MMNSVMLVGRLTKTPELFSTESGKKGTYITLAINRPYKNADGEYETDYLDCMLWTGVAESAAEYCRKGDTVGVRGKLQTRIIENEDGTKTKKMDIIADRISFISSKPIDNNVDTPFSVDNEETDLPSEEVKNNKEKKKKEKDN